MLPVSSETGNNLNCNTEKVQHSVNTVTDLIHEIFDVDISPEISNIS